jgi:membrane-bound lytic murein transglycosylase D
VRVPEATDLRVVAKLIGVESSELEAINPALRRGFTPPGVANYILNLPKGSGKKFKGAFAKLPASERTTFVRHKIKRGETLGEIAERYSVPVRTIQDVNKIRDPRTLKVGHRIIVPVRPDQIAARTITHLVDKGDSLSSIALRYKVSVTDLKERNRLAGDTIRLGQKLRVDVQGSGVRRSSRSAAKASSKSPAKGSAKKQAKVVTWHRVNAGDSLSKIAQSHKLSVDKLRKLNKLTTKSVIHPGDRLRVRSAPKGPRRVTYTVQSGDTVWGISSQHNMSADEFRSLNGLKGNSIHPGQKLKVNEGAVTQKAKRARKSKTASSHTVVAGDTLSQIAEKHGVRTADLKRWNGIKSDKIRLGQVLRISSR